MVKNPSILWFKDLSLKNVHEVGGKNASLGEMMRHLSSLGIEIPNGFATTSYAFRAFMEKAEVHSSIKKLSSLKNNELQNLSQISREIRAKILATPFSPSFEEEIVEAYTLLAKLEKDDQNNNKTAHFSVAVRSSATLEDLPEASFAGQQETFLNVQGVENVLQSIKEVFASLYSERAISYRIHHGFSHDQVLLSVGIQKMVRSDCGISGVMFTLDTESGFDQVILINSSYGLGELVVQGAVNPDEFYIYKNSLNSGKMAIVQKRLGSKKHKMIYAKENNKTCIKTVSVEKKQQNQFSITDEELALLANMAVQLEKHYNTGLDIEWAKDGLNQKFYILQARPETVKSRIPKTNSPFSMERYELRSKGNVLVEGRSVGSRIGQGKAKILHSLEEMHLLESGDVLITDMTDPDWEPIMKKASAIVTNRGGRTCHAAIIARELGIPAVVGSTIATQKIKNGQAITVSCAEGDTGYVYEGLLDFSINQIDLQNLPYLPFKMMMTIGNPERAFDFQRLPNEGVGLARLEFIINQTIGVHPRACLEWETLSPTLKKAVLARSLGYHNPIRFYVDKLAEGIATLACAFWPKPVIVRLSDFKSNEYANLLGGKEFEPIEENPMLGLRGASRYISETFRESFALECESILKVRNHFGLTNVQVMVPFVRTPMEAKQVVELLENHGLKRGEQDLRIIMMCEIPANVLLAEEFLTYFDGFSIGSNDLTQLTLGLDRDSGLVAHHFDERDEAVRILLQKAIETCKKLGKSIGICGQGPSDHPDLAEWLVDKGIESLSLNPDSVLSTWALLAKKKV